MNWVVGWTPAKNEFLEIDRSVSLGGGWTPVVKLGGHNDSVIRAKFSPDGRLIASCSADRTVRIYDLETKKLVGVGRGHTAGINDFDWHSSGRCILTASSDSSVICFDLRQIVGSHSAGNSHQDSSRIGVASIVENCHKCACMAISCPKYCGQYFITGGYDESVKKWDFRKSVCLSEVSNNNSVCAPVLSLKAHSAPLTSLEMSHDDKVFASASFDGSARIWDSSNFEPLRTFIADENQPCVHAVFSPNSYYLLCVHPPCKRPPPSLSSKSVSPNTSAAICDRDTTSSSLSTSNCCLFDTFSVHKSKALILPPANSQPPQPSQQLHTLSHTAALQPQRPKSQLSSANTTTHIQQQNSHTQPKPPQTPQTPQMPPLLLAQSPGPAVFAAFWRDQALIPLEANSPHGSGVHAWHTDSAIHLYTIDTDPSSDRLPNLTHVRRNGKNTISSTTSVCTHPDADSGLIATTSCGSDCSTVVWMYEADSV